MSPAIAEQSVADEAVRALRAALGDRLVAVVLFGSRARGDARPESDWDLLVLADDLPENVHERRLLLKQRLPASYRGGLSLLIRTPAEFESRLPSLYLDIALDGQILYDRDGYATHRLGELRRIMDKAGLYRLRTSHGDVWRWREQPPGPWVLEWEQ